MPAIPSIMRYVIDFALPARCPTCGVCVDDDHKFCFNCWQKLEFINAPWCFSCGMPFSYERPHGTKCGTCIDSPPAHDGVRAAVVYDDMSSQLIIRLKYSGRIGVADLVARRLHRFMHEFPADALLVPVPLHRWRLWSRGYNQSLLIARALARLTGFPLSYNLLRRHRATPPLRNMSGKARAKTVANAFSLDGNAQDLVAGKTILLVDDVYTSGATANACAKILKQSGAKRVYVLCWARVVNSDHE